MLGKNIRDLAIYTSGRGSQSPLKTYSGNKGNTWILGNVTVTLNNDRVSSMWKDIMGLIDSSQCLDPRCPCLIYLHRLKNYTYPLPLFLIPRLICHLILVSPNHTCRLCINHVGRRYNNLHRVLPQPSCVSHVRFMQICMCQTQTQKYTYHQS